MIIEIGGEGALRAAPGGDASQIDILGKIARDQNAMIFALEHRFYGKSHPFKYGDKFDAQNQNLHLLNSQQAIADLANFIDQMDQKYCKTERIDGKLCFKWIIAGGSYPGAVTGFIMQKLQFMFAAGVSSSGVVNAIHSIPEFDQHTFAAAGTPCGYAYNIAMREIEEALENGSSWPIDLLNIEPELVAADGFIDDFYYFLADAGLMAFQYGSWTDICQHNLNNVYRDSGNVTIAFLQYIKERYDFAPYSRVNLKNANVGQSDAFRQWWYQTCSEFAYFQPAPQFNSIRSQKVTLQYHYDVCNYAFNMSLNYDIMEGIVKRTNDYYGSDMVYGNDTIFTNFWQDVWHICGVTTEKPNSPNYIFIDSRDSGHCADLHTESKDDPIQLQNMRSKVFDFVASKLDEYRT